MIFTIIGAGLFAFKAPVLTWLSIPICFAWLFIKSEMKSNSSPKDYDEFAWWQDDRGTDLDR